VNRTKLAGSINPKVLGILVVCIAVAILSNLAMTGFAAYSKTTVENNSVNGEASVYSNGTWGWNSSGDFTGTWSNENVRETIDPLNGKLIWDYYFNTSYNETSPARIEIIGEIRPGTESINLKIYNYNNDSWVYLDSLVGASPITDVLISSNMTYPVFNLSNYIDNIGSIRLVFEDNSRTINAIQIDYLAINVTVSPLTDKWIGLSNNTDGLISNGLNWTRDGSGVGTGSGVVNFSAQWNASSVSVVDGALVVNDSNTMTPRSFNVSESPLEFGFSENWTNFTLNLSNTSMFRVAGNYSLRMMAWDSFYQQNTSSAEAWLSLWSHASVSAIDSNETGNQVLPNGPAMLYCRVIDSNSSWQVNGYNVSFYNNSDYIGSNLTNATGWSVHAYSAPATNMTITCNITDQYGIYYYASASNEQNLTLEVINDNSPPTVNSIRFRYRNVTTNSTNLYANLSIRVNVTDNPPNATTITSVTANVTYPGGDYVFKQLSQNQSSSDLWFVYFNTTNKDMPVNETGTYSVYVAAYDEAENYDLANHTNNDNTNFTAFDTFNVSLYGYVDNTTTYNRGEGLSLYALDVNGLVIGNVNWTVNITRFGLAEQNLSDMDDVTNYTYFIQAGDPIYNWTIEVVSVTDALYGANTGSRNISFNVSSTLYPYFLYPLYSGRVFGLSASINASSIKARVNVSRNVTANYGLSLNFSYPNDGITRIFEKEGGTATFSNNSVWSILSPASYSTNFMLYLYASDPFNNSGTGSINMRTSSQPVINDPGGGGGVSGGVGGPSCNCTAWEDVDCGPTGGCPVGYMYQTRTCDPSGCGNETQCIRARVCDLVRAFNVTVDREGVGLQSGENETVKFTFANTGEANITLNLTVWIEKDCCTVSFRHILLDLPVQKSAERLLEIHAPVKQQPGTYEIKLLAKHSWLEKEQSIIVDVIESPELERIEVLTSELESIDDRIDQFRDSGVWVGDLGDTADRIRDMLRESEIMADEDNINGLKGGLNSIESSINEVKGQMTVLEVQRFVLENKWWILLAMIIIIAVYYAVFEIMLPLRRLSREIRKLTVKEREMVNKRKEVELQYFKGKINSDAFNKMLIGEQGKILGARGKAAEKIEEKRALIRSRLSPAGILRWLASGPAKLIRRFSRRSGSSKEKAKPKSSKK